MSNHSFMFLDTDFKDISKFCMRMEKNIVEGDGVDAVIWAGKIAERITNYITQFIELDLKGLKQHEKLERLFEEEVIPDNIYKDFNTIRHYRNIATHRDLRDELSIANSLHRTVFNLVCWFYGTYSGDDSFFNKRYIGITYQHDPSFIDMITNKLALNDFNKASISDIDDNLNIAKNDDSSNIQSTPLDTGMSHVYSSFSNKYFSKENVNFNNELNCWTAVVYKNNKTITIGHFKNEYTAIKRGFAYVNSDEFRNYSYISIPPKLKGGVYSYAKGINFSEKNYLWTASFNKKFLGYFISEGSAITARKQYIDTLPLPEKKNGSYSDYKEISFDENHKLWFIKKDGEIYDYYDSEEEAIYNLSNVLNLDIPIEDLGIKYSEEDSKWRFYYKGKFVGTYDSEKEAIDKRLKHISQFAQPKRNKNGDFSVHRGIFYDEKNLIWVLKIKNEIIGFYDSEEDAFDSKKEFLRLKGLDVSNLEFNQEEIFDDDFDFKVKLYSEENAIEYNKNTDEWVAYFMGRIIGSASDEESARKLRKQYLKTMPFVPLKSNGKYSLFEGIDYDKDNHLWISYNGEEFLGLFDSEEDAFYARKESLIAAGEDVSNLHFSKSPNDYGEDGSIGNIGSSKGYLNSSGLIDYKSSISNGSDLENDAVVSKESEIDNVGEGMDLVSATEDSVLDDSSSLAPESTVVDSSSVAESDSLESEESVVDIEKYKKSPLFGIGLKRDENNFSALDNITYDDLESDVDIEEEEDIGIDLENKNIDDNGFINMNENIDLKLNRRNLKEITLKSFDDENYRNDITISYNQSNIYLSLQGMIKAKKLQRILSLNLLDNSEKLEFNKIDSEYFSIFFRLKYSLESMNFNLLFSLLSLLGWNFDLLNILNPDFGPRNNGFNQLISNYKKFAGDSQSAKEDNLSSEKSNSEINESLIEDDDSMESGNITAKSDQSKESSNSNGRKTIRGGKVVSEEEAEKIDHAKPVAEIKSNIISKKPESIKHNFTSSSLADVIKWSNGKEPDSDESIGEDLGSENLEYEDIGNDISGSESDDSSVSSSETIGLDASSSETIETDEIFSFDEDSNFDLDDALAGTENSTSEEDITISNNSNDDSGIVSSDSDDSDGDINKVLEILERSKQNSIDDEDSEDDEAVTSANDDLEKKSKKVKKPKKAKKPKKLAADAFDEKYANSLEIEHDEENDKWQAFVCGNLIKVSDNPKEAFIARKKYLTRMVKRPKKNMEGKYSSHEGIDFDFSERMWTSSINGVTVIHSMSEKDAIKHRGFFIDVILPKMEIEEEDFNEEALEKIIIDGFEKIFEEADDE